MSGTKYEECNFQQECTKNARMYEECNFQQAHPCTEGICAEVNYNQTVTTIAGQAEALFYKEKKNDFLC